MLRLLSLENVVLGLNLLNLDAGGSVVGGAVVVVLNLRSLLINLVLDLVGELVVVSEDEVWVRDLNLDLDRGLKSEACLRYCCLLTSEPPLTRLLSFLT
jgi:hypothetical protein